MIDAEQEAGSNQRMYLGSGRSSEGSVTNLKASIRELQKLGSRKSSEGSIRKVTDLAAADPRFPRKSLSDPNISPNVYLSLSLPLVVLKTREICIRVAGTNFKRSGELTGRF